MFKTCPFIWHEACYAICHVISRVIWHVICHELDPLGCPAYDITAADPDYAVEADKQTAWLCSADLLQEQVQHRPADLQLPLSTEL